jgi:hypothetical protein
MIKQLVYLDGVTFPLGTEFSSNQKANETDCSYYNGRLRIPYKELKKNASPLNLLTDIIDVPKNCFIAVKDELDSFDKEKGIKGWYSVKPNDFTNQNYNWDDDEITPPINIKPESEKLDFEINVDGETDDKIQLSLDFQDLKRILKRSNNIDNHLRATIYDILTNRGYNSISEALMILRQELHEIQRCKRFISDLILGDDEHIEDSFKVLQEQYERLKKEWYLGDYSDDDNPDEPFESLDKVLTAFKENKKDFFENFGKYVYSEFFDLFKTRLPQDFLSFNSDLLQPVSWTLADVDQGYRPNKPSDFTIQEDSYWFRLYDLPIDIRDILIEKLRDAFDKAGFREKDLEEEIKTLENILRIRIPITLYVLGSNDILKIANKANKDLKFINYEDINEITESELSKLKNFKYYIDSNCRITVITNNNSFYKFIPKVSIESLNAPTFYESVLKVLENKEKDLSEYIKNESLKFLRKRLNDPEKFRTSISHYKGDEDYMDTIKDMIKIKNQLYYVTNIIPEDKRELYAKTDWYMCRFLQGESLHGVIEQTLL